jgi:hypothetical protein
VTAVPCEGEQSACRVVADAVAMASAKTVDVNFMLI